MTEIYLVRHGLAAERGKKWPDDSQRPLTHKGRARMRQVTSGLQALGVELDLVLTSPLVRARQTADLVHKGLGVSAPVEETLMLAPGGPPAALIELLRKKKAKRVALVGHEPDLGQLAAFLIGARAPLVFKKGGVCRIDFEKLPPVPPGHLVWFALPQMLR
jgi:phosphohistidine phosphatase